MSSKTERRSRNFGGTGGRLMIGVAAAALVALAPLSAQAQAQPGGDRGRA